MRNWIVPPRFPNIYIMPVKILQVIAVCGGDGDNLLHLPSPIMDWDGIPRSVLRYAY